MLRCETNMLISFNIKVKILDCFSPLIHDQRLNKVFYVLGTLWSLTISKRLENSEIAPVIKPTMIFVASLFWQADFEFFNSFFSSFQFMLHNLLFSLWASKSIKIRIYVLNWVGKYCTGVASYPWHHNFFGVAKRSFNIYVNN